MTITLDAPEVREQIERAADETAQASGALDSLQELAGIVLRAAERCVPLPGQLRRRWEEYEAKSPAGTPDSLAPAFASFREFVADALHATEGVRGLSDLLAKIDLFPKETAERVRQAEGELRQILERHDKLWARIKDPGPMTFDEEMSRQSREAYARGEYEDLADIIKRVQAGGEL